MRGFLAAAWASASLLAASLVGFVSLVGVVSFDSWPHSGARGVSGFGPITSVALEPGPALLRPVPGVLAPSHALVATLQAGFTGTSGAEQVQGALGPSTRGGNGDAKQVPAHPVPAHPVPAPPGRSEAGGTEQGPPATAGQPRGPSDESPGHGRVPASSAPTAPAESEDESGDDVESGIQAQGHGKAHGHGRGSGSQPAHSQGVGHSRGNGHAYGRRGSRGSEVAHGSPPGNSPGGPPGGPPGKPPGKPPGGPPGNPSDD